MDKPDIFDLINKPKTKDVIDWYRHCELDELIEDLYRIDETPKTVGYGMMAGLSIRTLEELKK